MSSVRFNLKDTKSANQTLILATFCYKGNRIRFSTEISINPKYWNKNSMKAREVLEFKKANYVNEKLNQISSKVTSIYNNHLLNNSLPDKQTLKHQILHDIKHFSKTTVSKSFWDYYNDFVEFKRNQISDIRDYHNSLRKHLKAAELNFKKPITFDSLKDQQNGFIDCFNHYLNFIAKGANGSKGMSLNTIGKQHKNLKVFLNWCFDKGIYERYSLKHIVTEQEEIESVYITKSELDRIVNYKPNSSLEKAVKELFLIGCETGLRFSDFSSLSRNNIVNNNIHYRPKKTKKDINNKVIIPISSIVKDILNKNNGNFPNFRNYSLVEFNKTIRKIAKELNINSKIQTHRKVNGTYNLITYSKYEMISSHTCRRTFCTQKFLDGMPVQAIMKFSGHKTERAFMKYLRLDQEIVAIKYKHFF